MSSYNCEGMGSEHCRVETATNLESALTICLGLREHGFYSFRGQRNASWSLGLHGISSVEKLDDHLEQFRRRCMEFPPPPHIGESDHWRWLFFAQHYRLKTRLLDWSKNPLVAIYFAVENILSGVSDESGYGAVWAVRVSNEHFETPLQGGRRPDEIADWTMVNPPPVTPRIGRQSSVFSYHPGPKPLSPINKQPRRKKEDLVKIEIKRSGRSNPSESIRQQLGILNIHHGSLFPDPEGIAQFVNYEWPILQK